MLNIDKDIVRTIMYVTSSLGEQLLSGVSSEHEVRNLLSRDITSSSKLLEETAPPAPVNVSPPKEEPIQEEVSMMSLATRQKKPKRSRPHRDLSSGRNANSSQTNLEVASMLSLEVGSIKPPEDINDKKPVNASELLMNASRAELLNAVSLVLDLGGFTVGIDESFHNLFHDSFKNMLASFKSDTSLHMHEFGQCMSENYGTIRLCSQRILVKQKENVSIQTEAAPRKDEEIQCGDENHTGRKK